MPVVVPAVEAILRTPGLPTELYERASPRVRSTFSDERLA